LLPAGSGGENTGDTGGLSGELGAVTRDDSDAEEDWLTLKAISESLSSWEPLRDPDGDVVAGLDCRVPETKETPSGVVEGESCSASPWLFALLHLSFPICLMGG